MDILLSERRTSKWAVTMKFWLSPWEIGDALLRNGAEVYRVEDTVMHILEAYEIEKL